MHTFRTVGSGASQTLHEIEDEKIPIYDSLAAAEADLANLEENQIVATKDKAVGELLRTVDVVQSGNMHPVTSNAVAGALAGMGELVTGWQITPGDYAFVGNVIKIGKVVIVCGRVICAAQNSNIIISGLPVNKSNNVQNIPSAVSSSDYTTVTNSGVVTIEANQTVLKIDTGNFTGKQFNICLVYITD